MITNRTGSTYTTTVTNQEVCEFAARWPCHGLDTDSEYVFEFSAETGDLVDVNASRNGRLESVTETESGSALRAMSEDAGREGALELGLQDVLDIRYGGHRPAM